MGVGLEIGLKGSRFFWHLLNHCCQRIFVAAFLIILNLAIPCKADDDKNYVERKPKFFFISSSSTTSIVTTTTVCYSLTAGSGACTGRKRRAMIDDIVQPAPASLFKSDEAAKEIESGHSVEPEEDARDGRFLLYWRTTTVTTTTTSYTATSTLATIACTPSSFTLNACG